MDKVILNKNGKHLNGHSNGKKIPAIGILEWFHINKKEHVERTLKHLKQLGISHLRTGFSWADYMTPDGKKWYDWLIPRLAEQVEILPCFLYTPPSLGLEAKTSSPPLNPKSYADFLDEVVNRYGEYFEWVELWNEPNNRSEYDYTLDHEWHIFSEMIGGAAYWMKHLGKKTVLGGMSPIDPNWIKLMAERGVLQYVDAVGIHGFPGVFDHQWNGWQSKIKAVRKVLQEVQSPTQIWITEAGYSTWKYDERQQVKEFLDVLEAQASRVYWYSLQDLAPQYATVDGFHTDEREYYFGLMRQDESPKLLYRLLSDKGIHNINEEAWITETYHTPIVPFKNQKRVLITGGAGFIGTNLADAMLQAGHRVTIYDNLSRDGVQQNIAWLKQKYRQNLTIEVADIRDAWRVEQAVNQADVVYHFAAQVAVTTSFDNPENDYDINVKGTLNVLNAARKMKNPPAIIFTSTNKVYGELEDLPLKSNHARYVPEQEEIAGYGVSENRSLDFHSPYGCSKGAADQYMMDYARSFGLKTVVFRMSCIYGPHQCGCEDQGWVAHFLISALKGHPITLYGDGMQVRDILYVEDLVRAFRLAWENSEELAGQAFNIGGSTGNAVSLKNVIRLIENLSELEVKLSFGKWRPGDQKYYVSDIRKFSRATGWKPKVSAEEGIANLYHWLKENLLKAPVMEKEPTLEKVAQ